MSKVQTRKRNALDRLEKQLSNGTKTAKKINKQVPLTETDKVRINKEIQILKNS